MKKIIHTILRSRIIVLPVLSGAGVVFFALTDYYDYPTIEIVVLFVWVYTILFYIAGHGRVRFEQDEKGNLTITKKTNNYENTTENHD